MIQNFSSELILMINNFFLLEVEENIKTIHNTIKTAEIINNKSLLSFYKKSKVNTLPFYFKRKSETEFQLHQYS